MRVRGHQEKDGGERERLCVYQEKDRAERKRVYKEKDCVYKKRETVLQGLYREGKSESRE